MARPALRRRANHFSRGGSRRTGAFRRDGHLRGKTAAVAEDHGEPACFGAAANCGTRRSAVAAAHGEPRCFGAEVKREAKRSVAAADHGEPQRFGAAGRRGTRRSLAITVLRCRVGREVVTVGGEGGASASCDLPGVGAADRRHGASARCRRAVVAVAQRTSRASARPARGKTAGVVCGRSAFRRGPALVERSAWTRSRFGGSAKGRTRAVFATRAFRRARRGSSDVRIADGRSISVTVADRSPLAVPASRRFVLRCGTVVAGRGFCGACERHEGNGAGNGVRPREGNKALKGATP